MKSPNDNGGKSGSSSRIGKTSAPKYMALALSGVSICWQPPDDSALTSREMWAYGISDFQSDRIESSSGTVWAVSKSPTIASSPCDPPKKFEYSFRMSPTVTALSNSIDSRGCRNVTRDPRSHRGPDGGGPHSKPGSCGSVSALSKSASSDRLRISSSFSGRDGSRRIWPQKLQNGRKRFVPCLDGERRLARRTLHMKRCLEFVELVLDLLMRQVLGPAKHQFAARAARPTAFRAGT